MQGSHCPWILSLLAHGLREERAPSSMIWIETMIERVSSPTPKYLRVSVGGTRKDLGSLDHPWPSPLASTRGFGKLLVLEVFELHFDVGLLGVVPVKPAFKEVVAKTRPYLVYSSSRLLTAAPRRRAVWQIFVARVICSHRRGRECSIDCLFWTSQRFHHTLELSLQTSSSMTHGPCRLVLHSACGLDQGGWGGSLSSYHPLPTTESVFFDAWSPRRGLRLGRDVPHPGVRYAAKFHHPCPRFAIYQGDTCSAMMKQCTTRVDWCGRMC